ncbi:MAG: WbqC family protein [Bacteroidales bacterium]|nr:WbqC family protein [Bacteroidales bacterium]MCI1785154.1 WbqC family protein [Bacteroidales bacterium]
MLLSTAYFPPVEYFAVIAEDFSIEGKPSRVYIEACENYQKQSYRNRCRFYAADGVQSLSVPVVHEGGTYQLPVCDIKIDYSSGWLVKTERAIISAYETSAYFDYYKDELFAILESKKEKLFDLNMALLDFFLAKTGIKADISLTEDFTGPDSGSSLYGEDFRDVIHPKKHNDILHSMQLEKPYFQVFSGKYGFIPNLSIMDLLFNEGPDSILYLKKV